MDTPGFIERLWPLHSPGLKTVLISYPNSFLLEGYTGIEAGIFSEPEEGRTGEL